ncbi:sushi domain-containing protein 3-like [Heteronotia binoei]|uniref:sushi domain-containing protein 3-like n=1 Tax=Heteronotia binoei TaxID=13085 RepID=UPI0029304A6C|nr:sushi domain-containing protein 3-like [Heteronotia binoei]
MHTQFGYSWETTGCHSNMKKPRSREHTALCLLAWSCLEFALGESLESPASTPGEETSIRTFLIETANGTSEQSNFSAPCAALPPPSHGFMYIDEGSGSSLGSVVIYWCREGYQLVGNGKLTCLLKGHLSYWSHPPPHCEVIPKPLDKGFRVAVIASLISGVIIVTMSISFAVCCLRDRMLRGTEHGYGTGEG